MSLLNDALRKKRSERQPTGEPHPAVLMKLGPRFRHKRRWMFVSGCLALLVAGSVAWWYGFASESASSPGAAVHSVDLVQAHADEPGDRQAVDNSTIIPVARPSAPPAQSAVAAVAVAEPQVETQRSQTQPEMISASASGHSAAITMEQPKIRTVDKPAAKKTIDHVPRRQPVRHGHDIASLSPTTDPVN